jgi:hypothetical protein
VDARGTFTAGVAAGPVYRSLGKKDLSASVYPPIETGIHNAGHTANPNWPYFLAFAERKFREKRE